MVRHWSFLHPIPTCSTFEVANSQRGMNQLQVQVLCHLAASLERQITIRSLFTARGNIQYSTVNTKMKGTWNFILNVFCVKAFWLKSLGWDQKAVCVRQHFVLSVFVLPVLHCVIHIMSCEFIWGYASTGWESSWAQSTDVDNILWYVCCTQLSNIRIAKY